MLRTTRSQFSVVLSPHVLIPCWLFASAGAEQSRGESQLSGCAVRWCHEPCKPTSSPPTPDMIRGILRRFCALAKCLPPAIHICSGGSIYHAWAHQALESSHGKAQSWALNASRSHRIIPDDKLLEMSVPMVKRCFL